MEKKKSSKVKNVSLAPSYKPTEQKTKDYYDSNGEDSGWDTDLEAEDYQESICSYGANSTEKYIEACKHCGVTPASYFIRNMKNQRLNMAHHGLGVKGIKALTISLMTNTHLTALNLGDNGLGEEGVSLICEMLMDNIFISELDLSENNIGHEGVKHLCDVLQLIDHVKRLTIKGNGLTLKSAILLSHMLEKNTSLKYLDISHNAFAEECGLHFGPAISNNEYLEELDLSWNHIRQKGACAVAKGLQENISLKKLDVSWNGFADDGMYVLSNSLKINSSLQHLNISSNRITHVGAEHLQKALQVNENLIVLKISQNPIQQGSINLLKGIKANENVMLVDLDLTGVQVNQQFIELLEEIQKKNSKLQIYHGGLGGSSQKAVDRPKPMKILRDYIKNNQMRVFDFFKSLDKDKSMSISIAEFVKGLKEQGVPLRIDELLPLVLSLDLDGNGEIEYKEFVVGHQEAQKEERQEILKEKAKKERKKKLSKNLAPSTPTNAALMRSKFTVDVDERPRSSRSRTPSPYRPGSAKSNGRNRTPSPSEFFEGRHRSKTFAA